MKTNFFTEAVDEVIKLKMEVADEYIKDIIESIGDVGNPEKLIGKKYEDWTPVDLQRLTNVYGTGDDTPLAKLIFNKSLKEVQDLEREVG